MKIFFFLVLLFFFISCTPDYSPKPSGYFHIDLEDHNYKSLIDYPEFEFNISNQVEVIKIPEANKGKWFNLAYPRLNAQIYCSYLPITKMNLEQAFKKGHEFIGKHTVKIEEIQEQAFESQEQNVYGFIYKLKGEAASPIQFMLTDSISSFFRGALYFNDIPNQDSIAPVLEYINKDIQIIIESFRWKK